LRIVVNQFWVAARFLSHGEGYEEPGGLSSWVKPVFEDRFLSTSLVLDGSDGGSGRTNRGGRPAETDERNFSSRQM
jgi:hypothetical protein